MLLSIPCSHPYTNMALQPVWTDAIRHMRAHDVCTAIGSFTLGHC